MNNYLNSLTHIRIPRDILILAAVNENPNIVGLYIAIYQKVNYEDTAFKLSYNEISKLSQFIYTKENAGRFRRSIKKSLDILKEANYILGYSTTKSEFVINTSFEMFIPVNVKPEDIRILSLYDYRDIANKIYTLDINTTNVYGNHKVSVWDALMVFVFLKFKMSQWHKTNDKATWKSDTVAAKITYEELYANISFSDSKIKLIFDILKELNIIAFTKPIKYINTKGFINCGRTIVVECTAVSEKRDPWQEELNRAVVAYSKYLKQNKLYISKIEKYLVDVPTNDEDNDD